MKTIRFFAAAIALLSVLSCQKEAQENNINPDIKGGQLITCGFANNDPATKTTLDGWTPKWAVGDKIMLYDGGSNKQELTLAASGTASSTEGIIDGTDATKFTFAKPSGWEHVYAIYPSSACVSGFSASAPKFNFAGQDGSFAKANICVAVDVSDTMSFKNVGAILKFPSKPAAVTGIQIPVAGLAKDYIAYFSGRTPSLTPEDATNSSSFSIGSGTGDIYIGVPAGEEIAKGSAFIYKGASSSIQGSYLTGSANTTVVNKIYKLPAIEANGKLYGVFTVGAASGDYTGKVQFSKGNLYCTTSPSVAYSFESNQCDFRHYCGQANDVAVIGGSSTTTPANTVGSFFFSKDASIACASTYSDGSAAASDKFFTNDQTTETKPNSDLTVNGSIGLWRALTSAEWTYLLNTRTDANRFAKANVRGVPGLIIFPDGYTGTISGEGIAAVNSTDSDFPPTSIAPATWTSMESAGCVFLPAVGLRATTIGEIGNCCYWSSTPKNQYQAYGLYIGSSYFSTEHTHNRTYGLPVRLVCAVQ